jgi:osmoprotectant transport system permease protein
MKTFLVFFLFSFNFLFAVQDTIKIGSKRFTESYILGEILKQLAEEKDEAKIVYKPGLGNTGLVFAALQEGMIDIYPDYTGTIQREILKLPDQQTSIEALRAKLNPLGLQISDSLGFNNSYALAMDEEKAEKLNIRHISDLAHHPELKLGFSQEFLERQDGWLGLKESDYQLPFYSPLGIDHSLSYEALAGGQIDITDVYTTDPRIKKYHLHVLEDDRHFFPSYEAVLLYRLEAEHQFPKTWQAFQTLSESLSNQQITAMNAQAEFQGKNFKTIAQEFLQGSQNFLASSHQSSLYSRLFESDLWDLTKQHLFLVFGSLIPAIIIGIPLGILATKSFINRHFILSSVGLIQTIPYLALLAFLIPILQQIGILPALVALFLYALLPIVRNTYAGLTDISKPLQESAIALGLPPLSRLRLIELPLATRTILEGIKTAAVINVGMATIAAAIGAGGYGERIMAGLALNDNNLLLAGAIPACLLAFIIQISFDGFDYLLIPKGLRYTHK